MHVIVVGCGRVGRELAVDLEAGGHQVAIIDKSRSAFSRLPERWTGQSVVGFGFDRDTLETAGIQQAGALAAVTNGDNTNIVTARIARETYEVPNVVARIYDPRRAAVYQRLGIPTVATVSWTTDQVIRRLFPEQRSVDWVDATGSLSLLEVALPDGWCGHRLSKLEGAGWRLVGLHRAGTTRLAEGELVGQEGDVLHIAVRKAHVDELDARLNAGGANA
ncbi:MAG TPA: TrkA family potassium uptake protein [Acidimicrobiales bacterium]|nr:TrkA family potassium uptake protein [Acidimicrobiales bacterium]